VIEDLDEIQKENGVIVFTNSEPPLAERLTGVVGFIVI